MLNLLLIENNLIRCQKIINSLSKLNKNMRINCLALSLEESLNIMKNEEIHCVILDLNVLEFKIEVFEELCEYKKPIIIISEKLIKTAHKNLYYVSNLDELIVKINKYLKEKVTLEIVKSLIKKEFEILNFNFKYIGTKYLYECIIELYFYEEEIGDKYGNKLYPRIAKKYNKSVDSIYGDIKQAVKYMYRDCREEIIIDYFKFDYCVKPTIKEIISMILNKIPPM